MRRLLVLTFVCLCVINTASAQPPEPPKSDIRRTPIVAAVEKAHASVVNISTERVVVVRRGFGPFFGAEGGPFDRLFEEFFGGHRQRGAVERKKVQIPLGSGSIITADGLVVTNEHVIRRATNLQLSLDTGETFEAVLLAADPEEDIALLRMKTDKPVRAIGMGTSSDLMLGETVVALGNPFGFESSVTSGIISAFDREITVGSGAEKLEFTGLIQTSALINPGNSGGPLVNVFGEIIGINTAVVDHAQGIGFAVPIDRARDVLAPLLSMPQVSEAWLGVAGETIKGRKGVRITRVDPKGPARGILKGNDVIVALGDSRVKDLFDLLVGLVQREPGDTVSLRISRGNKSERVRLALGRMPVPSAKEMLYDKFGIAGEDHNATLARRLGVGVDYGVRVSKVWPGSPAEKVGLERDDVIIQIGAHPVRNLHDAAAALRTTRAGQRVFVQIVRRSSRAYTFISVPR